MAKLIKIDRNGSKHFEGMVTCDRCQGRGWFATGTCNGQLVPSHVDNAVCWKCHGAGKVFGKWIERTPEYQAKLDAKRQAKIAEKQAQWEAEEAEREKQRKAAEEAEKLAKEAEEARIKAQKAISQFVGTVGERITTTATFDHSAWFDFKLGGWMDQTMWIHTFKDADGNALIWKTSSNSLSDLQEGDQIQITGTVKEHSEYQDEKQTVLTRCKITRKG